jgi:hypothetical protein
VTKTKTATAENTAPSGPIAAAGHDWTFKLDINRICDIEEETDLSISQIVEKIRANLSISILRAVFKAGLRDERGMTASPTETVAVIEAIGLKRAAEMIGTEINRALGPRT